VGRVVKNARLNTQRYQMATPPVEQSAAATEDPGYFTAPPVVEAPAPAVPALPPVDVEAVANAARSLIDAAEDAAKELLAEAHGRARDLLDDAHARGERMVETARADARAEGLADGKAAADREMSDMMATMRNLVDMARVERHKLMESAEPELVRLAMGIAERVLHQQIALDRGVVVEMAKVAIGRLVERESVTVRVNPGDLERMRQHREEFLSSGDIKNFRILEDQRVDRGGVVVETDGGTIDAKISTQLNEAKRVLHIEDDVIVQPADAEAHETSLRSVRAS
jgi:flagellar biosynthesis/type III secretory pathway protein FliH